MRILIAAAITATLLSPLASAQKLNFNFDAVAAKATKKTELNLEGPALAMALEQVAKHKPDMAGKFGKALESVKGVYIGNYEFAKAGDYSQDVLEPLRKEVQAASGWSRIVHVHEKDESTEIYVKNQDGNVAGCLVLAAEPRELTIVQVVGDFPLAGLQELVSSHIAYDLKKTEASHDQ